MRRRISSRPLGSGAHDRFKFGRNAVSLLLATGLFSGLLGAPAATAAETPNALDPDTRKQIVQIWKTAGAGLRAAAENALLGGDDAIRQFLDEAESVQYDDNRIDAARIASTSGPATRAAAKEALFKSPQELEAFLLDGYEEPLDEDRKVEIARLATLGSPGVHDAAKAALEGTFADREEFLATGQYEAQADDDRVETARLATLGGPNVKAAAKVALQGTPEDIVEFLEIGQFTARNRDQEHASIQQLTDQAAAAGKQAEDATKKAQEASKKAIESSNLAKEAAKKAAQETLAAKNDSKRAAVKAAQAADAARAAAQAAQEAIGSANAANRAARRAALAAAQTASAAAAASDAANNAYQAAIAAAGDAAKADVANKAAATADQAAKLAKTSAEAANMAGKASLAAGVAARASKSASANALVAADNADDAQKYAEAAGLHSSEARAAAAEARRHAEAADRAADRSARMAERSAALAFQARDAANSAAKHATNAAVFAREAAKQAGITSKYAATAKKNADAAREAATDAKIAVATAFSVHALAREAEADDLQTRTEAGIERARSLKAASEASISSLAAQQVQALALDDAAASLAAEAGRPDVDVKATAAKGRELAVQAMKLLGPFHQEAAARALSGTDQDVLDYLRTRWKQANEDDIRAKVVHLGSQSPYPSVRTAATAALKGTPEQINGFYTTGQYAVGADDMKVDVARLTNTGGTGVKEAAKAALADGTGKALATFLQVTQYAERLTDEQVVAAQLTSTPDKQLTELSSAAKIALAGPPQLLHEFIATGRHMAQRKDNLTAYHNAQISVLLAEGRVITATADGNSWLAAKAAADAANADKEADAAAKKAQASADEAKGYAEKAKKSAEAAEASARDAAKSAATARAAADRADADAIAAENSAIEAQFSADYARQSAVQATASAAQARTSAIAAGKSSAEAAAHAKNAWQTTLVKREKELAEARRQAAEQRDQEQARSKKRVCVPHPTRDTLAPLMPCLASPDDSIIKMPEIDPTMRSIVFELAGINDIKECIKNPTGFNCLMAAAGALPVGKLKIVGKIGDGIESVLGNRQALRSVGCLIGAAAHSFPAGTKVLMADGSYRPIEQIQTGDLVTATDPVDGETGPRAVTRTIATPDDRDFTDVTLTDGSGLTSTDHHPYWAENRKRWIDAVDLRVGDALRTPVGTAVQVGATSHWKGLQPAYDLTVDDLHTYYVNTGTTDVLVHNTDETCPIWVKQAFDKLPASPEGFPTEGYAFYPDGKPLWDTTVKSGKGPNSEDVNRFLQASDDFPPFRGYASVSHHAEVKLAWEMRNKGGSGDMHIVINKNYVCPRVSGANAAGCRQAVPAILYEDQTLWVHYPGMAKGIPLKGTAKRKP
ncbi:polymorphic toxin-type HINT domain-containing protein [Streptomyces sp. NBC_00239]|uniref:polymorphic toxin-type HINT domain-containing protein n=1 Tax=Streptomyces sp. NBC_00239 TaxID=2903640 RepID=UPI002E2A7A3F|nr:polymorphic toxin-type HINT domain-containing protein [Streptomyces sp. NBC_00239]